MMASLYQSSSPSRVLTGNSFASMDAIRYIFNVESACGGALDSLSCFVHGDAIDMEMASHFVCGKGDVPDIYIRPFNGHWFPWNAGDGTELNTAILFLHLKNYATSPTVACKRRAEWTFSPKLKTSESRPNLSTVRVTCVYRKLKPGRSDG